VVLPVYNEVRSLKRAVEETVYFLVRIGLDFEVIIAEDGSTDGTAELAESISALDPRVKCFSHGDRLGRGRALTEAFRRSEGSVLVYMDVDLATELRFLEPLIEAVFEGYDMVTGSRALPQSRVSRSMKRGVTSLVYNSFVRLLLGSDIHDHQCGFKAFRRETLLKVLDKVRAKHWFWDTEILVLATRMGLSVNEVPISWREGEKTKVNLFRDFIDMGFQTLKLWWRLRIRSGYHQSS